MDNIEKYFKENKNKYPQEILINELKKSGYKEEDIREGAKKVFGDRKMANPEGQHGGTNPFWDFTKKKIYQSGSEKFLDFLFGFFAPWVSGLLNLISPLFALFLFIGYIFALFYLFNRRRYIFYGLIADMLLPIIALILFLTLVLPRIGGWSALMSV